MSIPQYRWRSDRTARPAVALGIDGSGQPSEVMVVGNSLSVLDGQFGLQVLGDIAGVAAAKVIKNTNADASTILGWRITVNAGDDFVAGDRLAEDGLDSGFIQLGESLSVSLLNVAGAVTVHTVAVANVAYNHATGTILPTGTTPAHTRTAMTRYDLEAGTRGLALESSVSYIISSVTYAMLMVRGYIGE